MQLLQAIGEPGGLKVGDRLPSDRDLADRMGVSRLTVREAILALEVVGILQVRSGDGTFVANDSQKQSPLGALLVSSDLRPPNAEVIEARLLLEPVVASLAARRAPDEALDDLERMLSETEALADDITQLAEFMKMSLGFHAELLSLCGNAQLAAFASALVDLDEHPLWTLLNAHAMQSVESRCEQVAEHRQILEAVRRREESTVAALMTEHLQHLRNSIDVLEAKAGH